MINNHLEFMGGVNVSRKGILKNLSGRRRPKGVASFSVNPDDEILIGVNGRGPASEVAEKAAKHIKTIDLGQVRQVVHGNFTKRQLNRLQNNNHVKYIEKNRKIEAISQTLPWGIDRVDADIVHDNNETGDGAHIAILDTGIDDDHPDLQPNVGAGKAYVDCSGSNCNYPWSDDNDHGTHVAGIADAIDNTTGVVGVSTEATLHAIKVLDDQGEGRVSDLVSGIKYVADKNWDVASMSVGQSTWLTSEKDAVKYAYDKGVLLVGAAGNKGPCSDCVIYPAGYSEVIAVSSTDKDDSLSSFSSTGPEVELAAPGEQIYSTRIGDYATFSGTSMACPHVSSAGSQLMANGYTNVQARDRLQRTAEDIELDENKQGHGLLDAEKAVLSGFAVLTGSVTNVDGSSATLNGSLNDLDGAESAEVYFEWRETGTSSWNTTNIQTLSSMGEFTEDISGLSRGIEYEFRALGNASDGDSGSGRTVTFTASNCVDATKWPSGTGENNWEHITKINMDGQVVKSSRDLAYYDFTCPDVVTVERGDSFDLALEFEDAGWDGHYGNVYVDWGQDYDWSTATETEIMENVSDDTATYTTKVGVPSDAAIGGTLARVRLSSGGFLGPTATDEPGEVNDFTMFIVEGISISASGEKNVSVGGEATLSLSAEQVDKIIIEKLWTDWSLTNTELDGGTITNHIASSGKVTITYSSIQDAVSPSFTFSFPDRYIGGDYLIEVDASNSAGGTAESTAVFSIG